MPLYAQTQQPNTAKLKAEAQKIVSNIRGDKAKTQAYCQINSLGGQMVEAAQEKDSRSQRLCLRPPYVPCSWTAFVGLPNRAVK
jgi:hypothetical protein